MIYSGGFSLGVPPLPIPNREVKPKRADGTAPQCGRVGRRLFQETLSIEISRVSFLLHIVIYLFKFWVLYVCIQKGVFCLYMKKGYAPDINDKMKFLYYMPAY